MKGEMERMAGNGTDPNISLSGRNRGKKDPQEMIKEIVFGAPRDLNDQSIFQKLSLVAFLAWIGLGADGLSSSAYGPEEAFRTLGEHTYLALVLALSIGLTIFIISMAYSRIIEEFPTGGGGYLVATKLLGERWGVVSGSALLVDYVLTIAVSVTSACDAIFSFLPPALLKYKIVVVVIIILFLMVINIRGVKESVLALSPIFVIFLATHVPLILGGIVVYLPETATTAHHVAAGFSSGHATIGFGAMALLALRAYSMGAGTYTGLEAVSNGLPIIREPRVHNGQRTMLYMAISLAFMASGLLLCYYLWNVKPVDGKTLNYIIFERLTNKLPLSHAIVIVTLLSEGLLLIVAAQTGFIGGPRVLTYMAMDSWVPRSFASLSQRLTTRNGVILMGASAIAVLLYTKGNIHHLIIMYSINVFVTFTLAMVGMVRHLLRTGQQRGRLILFIVGFVLCLGILVVTLYEKFALGGWVTVVVTTCLILLCFLIRRHYRYVAFQLNKLFQELEDAAEPDAPPPGPVDPDLPTAAVLVASYGGLGIHTVLNIFRMFPNYYQNLVFISAGIIDSGGFKGKDSIDQLRAQTEDSLKKYVELARGLGIPATYRFAIGTDVVDTTEKLCLQVNEQFPRTTYFAGKIIFRQDKWYERLLHNETAFAVQKRLQLSGRCMVIIPAKVA
jgi:amino acid transporter